MQCRHEHDMVALLQLVLILTLQLPVCFVDKHQDAWAPSLKLDIALGRISQHNLHSIIKNEHIFPRILHDLVAKISHKKCHIRRGPGLVPTWYRKGVLLLVVKEQL